MADYRNLDEMLAGTANLTITRNNSRRDSGYDTLSGPDWFTFNKLKATTIYAGGNGYLGFGATSEHLRINNRDQALYKLGWESGRVGVSVTYRFFRVYWKGVSGYSASLSDIANVLAYDAVLLDTGDIYVNVRTFPTNNVSNDNTIYSGGKNVSLGNLTTGSRLTLKHLDDTGENFKIIQGFKEPIYARVRFLFGDKDNKLYGVSDGKLTEITEEMTGDLFLSKGSAEIPSDLVKYLPGLKFYRWQDEGEGRLNVRVTAAPFPQTVACTADMSHSSIRGIKSIAHEATDDVTVSFSFDHGTWSAEKPLKDLTADDLAGWETNRLIDFRFKLPDASSTLASFTLKYLN